ncbi:MAG: hypothetical protein A2Y62_21320 [Candidatus Fischerbacteria bacterium RBG_13_37_8]|uniref:Glycosyl transferase family 1 domain-containing protein n=1 Tax=Candidatus Fischerbacteria bacterium RBG_13_37_8 TaxID=1817863 RepID=A0A1F5VP22_9BACT|nr:MAG: hypothetical protein A2Y62_21320 [Candidatus Fischerbacteria bacterium RBG_13_37_8]
MKILLITGIFPPDHGGPATYIPLIAQELLGQNHRISVITLSDALPDHPENYPYPIKRIKRRQNILIRVIKTIWSILHHAKDHDVLYTNGLHFEAVIANLILRKPLIHKFVGDYAWEKARSMHWTNYEFEEFQKELPLPFRLRFLKTIRNFYAQRAHHIIVPSIFLKKCVSKWGIPEEKITVVYNAAPEIKHLEHTIPSPLNTNVTIVYAGRLVSWKNVDSIIKIASDIKEAGIIIIGDGEEKENLQALAKKLKIEDRVWFTGYQDKKQFYSLMKTSDIFILFSNYEGFPHIILESMKIGIPVIATNAGGNSELLINGYNCLLIEKDNYQQLLSAVKQLLQDRETREKIIHGAEMTMENFSVSRMVSETEKVLLATVEKNRLKGSIKQRNR